MQSLLPDEKNRARTTHSICRTIVMTSESQVCNRTQFVRCIGEPLLSGSVSVKTIIQPYLYSCGRVIINRSNCFDQHAILIYFDGLLLSVRYLLQHQLRIFQLGITNFLSYDKAKIPLEQYNVIVGANASGKTNVIRILEFLSSGSNTLDDKRLQLNRKFSRNMPSSLTIDILLSEYETKILLELIINRKIDDYSFNKNLKHTLSLEWTRIYDNDAPPDTVILYFKNHLAIWKNGARVSITCIQTFPETIEELKSEFNESVIIENDEKLKRSYRDKNGISHSNLFAEKSFQDALLNGCRILSRRQTGQNNTKYLFNYL
jgi:hypothetical protein